MIYADLPAGATVFLDASVFIHHFEPNALYEPPATDFLERIENQELIGITTTSPTVGCEGIDGNGEFLSA
jgi:hypothetical protein